MAVRMSMTESIGRAGLVALALALAVALPAADESDWQAADGSFPDHGSCTYFGPTARSGIFLTEADDINAMRRRTKDTISALAMIPQPRRGGIVAPARGASRPGDVVCSGIDDCIQRTAEAAGVPLTYLTTDAEFLRRVTLDLTGRIPTKDQVLEFLADSSENKREKVVSQLLVSTAWADRWAMFFGDLFQNTQVTAQVNRYQWGRDSFHLYLRDSMRLNKPYDQMAREMLAAEGVSDGRSYPERYTSYADYEDTYLNFASNPVRASPVAYVVGGRTTGGPIQDTYDTLAFQAAKHFLGISLMDCVLCHDGEGHLDSLSAWGSAAKRAEGWGMAAFFSDIPRFQAWRVPGRDRPMDPKRPGRRVNTNYYFIHDLPIGREARANNGDTAGVYLGQTRGGNRPDRLHSLRIVEPSYPFEGAPAAAPAAASAGRLRASLGEHLTADPQFARAAVNYIWREFFSRGIVEPPDQFDLFRLDPGAPPAEGWDIQPSHPHLLNWLADEFRNNDFNLKWLMKEIVNSQAYQLSSRYEGVYNPLYERYFVRHQAKRLTAEQVHDAILVASGRPATYNAGRTMRGLSYAMQFPDVRNMPPGNGSAGRYARSLLQAFTPGDREQTLRSREGSPLQALNLMNNPFVLNRVSTRLDYGTLSESLDMPDESLVANLYLSVLSRHPTEEEAARALRYIQEGDRAKRASNLMWSFFNKTDFYFNY